MCESKELIVAYLYDDLTDTERQSFGAHLAACAPCREELAGLRATRGHLSSWAPPEPDFGFRIIREAAAPPARVLPMRLRWMPAFGLAAAALLVLAAATAIANLEVRYDSNGLVVRTGWARGAEQVAQGTASPATEPVRLASNAATPAAAGTAGDFALLDRRLRDLEAALANGPTTVQMASGPRMSDAEILRQVRAIVADAESRQQTGVAQALLQVVQDFDRQRRTDLAQLQQGIGQYQGLTNAEMAHTKDIVNQLMRVAAKQEK